MDSNNDLFYIEVCRAQKSCPRALINPLELSSKINKVFLEKNFNNKRKEILKNNVLHHHIFKVSLAGCPNCCSQPQIKDFGAFYKIVPFVKMDLCTQCGKCIDSCREKGISQNSEAVALNYSLCVGCGDCLRVCPTKALTAKNHGWVVIAGGKLGRHPQLAIELADMVDDKDVEYILSKCIKLFIEKGNMYLRFGDLIKELIL